MNEYPVPVRTELPGDVFRALEKLGAAHGVTVGRILSDLGTKYVAAQTAQRGPGGRFKITGAKERVLREMHAHHHSDGEISEAIGVDRKTVRNHRDRLGLPPVRNRVGAGRVTGGSLAGGPR